MHPTFQLPAELTIYSAQTTRVDFLAWLASCHSAKPGDAVEINGACVEEIDGAGMQLLGALTAAVSQLGLVCVVTDPSAHLQEVSRTLGTEGWLTRAETTGEDA